MKIVSTSIKIFELKIVLTSIKKTSKHKTNLLPKLKLLHPNGVLALIFCHFTGYSGGRSSLWILLRIFFEKITVRTEGHARQFSLFQVACQFSQTIVIRFFRGLLYTFHNLPIFEPKCQKLSQILNKSTTLENIVCSNAAAQFFLR